MFVREDSMAAKSGTSYHRWRIFYFYSLFNGFPYPVTLQFLSPVIPLLYLFLHKPSFPLSISTSPSRSVSLFFWPTLLPYPLTPFVSVSISLSPSISLSLCHSLSLLSLPLYLYLYLYLSVSYFPIYITSVRNPCTISQSLYVTLCIAIRMSVWR